jgi:hypothetical protein
MAKQSKITYRCRWVSLLMFINSALAQQVGSIAGKIFQDNGNPQSGAVVSAQLQRTSAAAAPFRTDAVTAKDGSFTITAPAGNYRLCVQPKQDPLLNTCDWNLSPTTIAVKAAAATTVPAIQLQRGVPIQVQIIDAQQLLPIAEGKTPGAAVLVGLWLPSGLFVPMPVQSKGATSRIYQTVVPVGVKVNLSVQSNSFQISDGNGNAINPQKGASVPTQFNAGATSQSFTFSVTGKQTAGPTVP